MRVRANTSRQHQIRLLTAGTILALLVMFLLMAAAPGAGPAGPSASAHRTTVGQYVSQSVKSQMIGPRYDQAVPSQDWSPHVAPGWAPSSAFVDKFRDMVIALSLVCVLMWVTLKGLGRFAPGLFQQGKGARPGALMKVLEKQTLGPGMSICLVEIAGKAMVVGMTDQAISPLCELSQEELERARGLNDEEQVADEKPVPEKSTEVFGGVLRHYMSILPGLGAKQ